MSVKSDFYKLTAASQIFNPNLQNLSKNLSNVHPKHMVNHFEFHKELTRKDELVSNLRTQLQYECENLFDYTPITFQISIPEGK